MKEILLGLLGIFGFAIACTVLMFILGAILWAIGKPWETFINWLDGPRPPMFDKVIWAEHEDRTWIRDKRRMARPAFILGLILLAACAIASRFELSSWLGFVVVLATFMGLGLVISPGLELLSVRRMEARTRHKAVCSGMGERHESAHRSSG
jgi:hypothetical protein